MSWRDRRWPLPPGLKVVSTVPGPVIPIETLRSQCEIVAIDGDSDSEAHPDDALILGALEAAVEHAESYTGLAIALRTYEMALDGFPGSSHWEDRGIVIKRPPLIRIDSFFATAAGSEGELDEGYDFILDDFRSPARLVPVTTWPTMVPSTNALRIRFTAGYLPDGYTDSSDFSASDYAGAQPLPKAIRQALLLLTRHFWDYRGDSVEKALATIPHGFNALLGMKRIETGFA